MPVLYGHKRDTMIYFFLYSLSTFLHFIALGYGVMTFKTGEDLFKQTSLKDVLKSKTELKYVATVCGTFGNVFFIAAKIPYIFVKHAHTTGVLEPLFAAGHITIALSLVIFHYLTYERVKDLRNA